MKVNDSQVFGEVFHSLIHSPLSMTLLQVIIFFCYKATTRRIIINNGPQLEATYAAAVEAVCKERDYRLTELEHRHTRWIFAFGLSRLVFVLSFLRSGAS